MSKNVYISSDHGGFELKEKICKYLSKQNYFIKDLGPNKLETVDYPDFSKLLANSMIKSKDSFGILFCGRVWVITTLGPYWTTRVISSSEFPLIRNGPYRFVRHPNYWVVTAEIAVLPLCLGAWQWAVVFSVLNAVLLWWRIRIENEALSLRKG